MRLTINIQGRTAIPVRAIPFITGWLMSPDVVASVLARQERITPMNDVFAYHLIDGEPRAMLPKEWDAIVADLEILGQRLKHEERFDQEKYPEWRKEAPACLPAGVFVWCDEFEAAFNKTYSKWNFSFLDDEREGERALNHSPYIPAKMFEVVIEGLPVDLTPAWDEISPEERETHQPQQAAHNQFMSMPEGEAHWKLALFPPATIDVIAQMFQIYPPEKWKRMGKDAMQIPWLLAARRSVKQGRGGSLFDPVAVAEGLIAEGKIGKEKAYLALIRNAPTAEVKEILQDVIAVGE